MPTKLLIGYFDHLVGRIYKILPMKESSQRTLHAYTDSLLYELCGIEYVTEMMDYPYYLSIIGVVSYLNIYSETMDTKVIKREVFKAIDLCKKVKRQLEVEGDCRVQS